VPSALVSPYGCSKPISALPVLPHLSCLPPHKNLALLTSFILAAGLTAPFQNVFIYPPDTFARLRAP
jgi:hypothetical protein